MIFIRLLNQLQASYSAKLIAIFIVTLCLMATALIITSNRLQKSSYTDYMRTSGLAMAQLLAKSVQLDVFAEDIDQLKVPVQSLLSQDDILQVEVMTSDGRPLIILRKDNNETLPVREIILTDIRDNAPYFKEWPHNFSYWWPVQALATTSSEDDLYFAAEPERVNMAKEPLGYVNIIVSKTLYTKNIQHMAIRTGLTIFLLLTLLLAGFLLLFRRMTLPLRTLIQKIKDQRQIGEVYDDIGLLDTTVTTLINDLDKSFQTIHELTTGLEDKVVERTRQLAMANKEMTIRQEYLEEANRKLEKAMKELKETEGQLIQSEKMAALGQVVAGVAHEINNNINFISGALPSLSRSLNNIKELTRKFDAACTHIEGEDSEKKRLEALTLKKELEEDDLFVSVEELIGNIREGVNRTTKIITDLHTFSRADDIEYKMIDLHESIGSTITFLNKKYLRGITIDKKYGVIPLVTCRPGRINQVFLNIMNNGIQAMADKGGTLQITSFLQDSEVHIRFTDTGSGISKEVLPRIFDPFFTNKDTGEGTGIGLSVSYKIVKEHHGRIDVTSREGEGSTFEVILPVNSKEAMDKFV